MFRQLGPTEILLILLVVVLLFGAKKLPDLARGSGRALRIFKAETKGLMDDDEKAGTPTTRNDELEPGVQAEISEPPRAVEPPKAVEQPERRDQAS